MGIRWDTMGYYRGGNKKWKQEQMFNFLTEEPSIKVNHSLNKNIQS
jgi:hypothetical protein